MNRAGAPSAAAAQPLLDKYGRNGPRYTSYPPAPLWHERVGAAELAAQIGRLGAKTVVSRESYVVEGGMVRAADFDSDTELYVHIPFCARLCTFCGCHTFITTKQSPVDVFLATIEKEADGIARAAGRSAGCIWAAARRRISRSRSSRACSIRSRRASTSRAAARRASKSIPT